MRSMMFALPVLLAACSAQETEDAVAPVEPAPEPAEEQAAEVPARLLFDRLSDYCGQAFEGRVVSDDPRDADWAAEILTIHFRECSPEEIRIPLHVGENRSRTWIISNETVSRVSDDATAARDASQLRLQHDHRHEDGTSDVLTMYGGYASSTNAVDRVEFPADRYSRELFEREEIPASMANVWSITVTDTSFTYALDRPERHFEAVFDLTTPVDEPPAPWGHE